MTISKINNILLAIFILACSACGVYSLSGASISPEVKTFFVKPVVVNAPLAPPNYGQRFSERLRERILNASNLRQSNENPDLTFESELIEYRTRPNAIGADQSASTRLTITVRVIFTNLKNDKQNFEQNFTRYADFPANSNLQTVETNLVKLINDDLVEDIFQKSFVNW